ncbi:integrase core domain-containing protein [Arcticibacter sp. MXS-1]|uniref:integrase core domain-containing protein n=1 Tax=Arcticibacter sp. MXS-1 TaxID=3341726 RepID=UPI0035A85ADF
MPSFFLFDPLLYLYRAGKVRPLRIEGQDGFVGRVPFRQDVLDSYMFDSLAEIRKYAQAWAWMYNNVRPHSSLGHLTPVEFLLKYGKLSEFPTLQQDNNNSNFHWDSLVLNVAS